MRPSPRGGAVAAIAAVLLLAGCGGGGGGGGAPAPAPSADRAQPPPRGSATPEPPTPEEEIRALVAERGAALAGGDVRGYAATAAGAQRGRDRRAARRARRIGLRGVHLAAASVRVDGRRARARVRAAFQIRGVRGSYQSVRRMDLVRADGGWRVRRLADPRALPPWETGAFQRRSSPHFVVLAPPEVPEGELPPVLEAGYERMRELLPGGSLRRRYLVVVATGATQLQALTKDIEGVDTLAAIADAAIVEQGETRRVTDVISVRLLVNWERFALLDPEERTRTVTHELTHAALAGRTSGRTPAWLVEGLALYVSGDRRPAPPAPDLAALSRPDAIARLSGDAQAAAYAASSAAAFAIADRHGRRALLELYARFGDPDLRGQPGRRLVDRALRRTLGTSLAELEAALA